MKEPSRAAGETGQLRPRLAELEKLASEKIDELQQTVVVRRDQGFEAAFRLVMTHRGKQLMDKASELVNEIKAVQRTEIDRRGAELQAIVITESGGR